MAAHINNQSFILFYGFLRYFDSKTRTSIGLDSHRSPDGSDEFRLSNVPSAIMTPSRKSARGLAKLLQVRTLCRCIVDCMGVQSYNPDLLFLVVFDTRIGA